VRSIHEKEMRGGGGLGNYRGGGKLLVSGKRNISSDNEGRGGMEGVWG